MTAATEATMTKPMKSPGTADAALLRELATISEADIDAAVAKGAPEVTAAGDAGDEVPADAEYRVDSGADGWWYYTTHEYSEAMDDANYRSRHASDDKVRVESRWLSDRTKWQPHGFYLHGAWTGAASGLSGIDLNGEAL